MLWARVGRTICRQCGREVERESPEVVATRLLTLPEGVRLLVGFDYPVVSLTPPPALPDSELDDEAAADEDPAASGGA